jgi:hypothetical protein
LPKKPRGAKSFRTGDNPDEGTGVTTDRLSNLHLIPPALPSVWATNQLHSANRMIRRPDGVEVQVEVPLFWYQPPWIQLPTDVAGCLAAAVANLDVVVSALRRDVCTDDQTNEFFSPIPNEEGEPDDALGFLPRMTPYRIERYGMLPTDFDQTRIVDVHLSASRDVTGRFAYSPEQMHRWEQVAEDSAIAGGGYVTTGTFPTDVVSHKQAATKLDQVRRLAPTAAVFLSIETYRLEEDLAAVLVSRPDGLILRMDQPELDGIQLAALVRRARTHMDASGFTDTPLWVVPGDLSPRDAAKLISLGAAAVAIDAWCNPMVEILAESLTTSRYDRTTLDEIPAFASQRLWDDIDHVIGLVSSISPDSTPLERLGTYHPRWAKACNVALLT